MQILGVTGGIATGKSSVCRWFSDHGIPVIDADALCHEFMKPNGSAYAKIVASFQPMATASLVDPISGEIDRKQLGEIVFRNPVARKKLEDILHPLVKKEMALRALKYFLTGQPMIVLEVPLLFESGIDKFVTKAVVVDW